MSTDKREYLKILDTLTDALGVNAGESAEEIKEELRNDGIDVDSILFRLKAAQKDFSMAAKRSALDTARKKRFDFIQKGRILTGQFKDWTREQLIDKIKEIGAFEAGLAYRDLEGMDTENLASILEDLETIKKNISQVDGSQK